MKKLLDKIFFRSNNLDYISQSIKKISQKTPVGKIFNSINSYSKDSEVRYVGGCLRKIINREKFDDIDLATNLEPKIICEILRDNNIDFFESGIEHGTITAQIDNFNFEITSLREDILTDGRHAKVKFSKDWKIDALRRDFTINSIYSNFDGNLFDPFNGKEDLEKGIVKFIGNTEERVKEDYLRILRYIRFFLTYSNIKHDPEVIRILKMNISGISKISNERLLEELKKILKYEILENLSKDKISLDLLKLIFPQLKNLNILLRLNSYAKDNFNKVDFIFILSLMVIDQTDNLQYFLYKFNISKKDQKRLENIDEFFKEKTKKKLFTEENLNKVFYYKGKQTVEDVLNFQIFRSIKLEKKIIEFLHIYEKKPVFTLPIDANILMKKYNIPQGQILGKKLKLIELEWVENNFKITDQQVKSIINN